MGLSHENQISKCEYSAAPNNTMSVWDDENKKFQTIIFIYPYMPVKYGCSLKGIIKNRNVIVTAHFISNTKSNTVTFRLLKANCKNKLAPAPPPLTVTNNFLPYSKKCCCNIWHGANTLFTELCLCSFLIWINNRGTSCFQHKLCFYIVCIIATLSVSDMV